MTNAMQLMAVGGNHKARQFFKQHGWDEVGSDKIEGKVPLPDSVHLNSSPLASAVNLCNQLPMRPTAVVLCQVQHMARSKLAQRS